MLISYKRGQTSVIVRVKIRNSSVTTGAGLTGLTNASSGLIISTIADNEATATVYTVAASNVETITTLGTYAAPTVSKCRFKEVDATNHPGVYELQFADARLAVASAKSLLVSISGATNAAQCDVVIPLSDLDPYDAVRAGLTAFPNVASGNAGALIVSGTGTAALSVTAGKVEPKDASISAATFAAGAIDANAIAANAIGASELAADAVTEIRDAITGGAYALSTDANGRIRIVDGTGAGEIDTLNGAIVQVNQLGTQAKADVNAEVDTALADIHLDHLFASADPGAAVANNSFWAKLVSKSVTAAFADFDNTTDSMQAIRDRGDAAWSTATGFSTHSAADVWSSGTRTLTTNAITSNTLDSSAVTEIRDAVTGGAYALATDANGRIRIVDGTGAGEIDTASGAVVQVNQLGTQAKADVNAELVDVMATDTHAQPGQETPAATTSYSLMLRYLFKGFRNAKKQTSSTFSLLNDDAVTVDHKSTLTDDGTTLTIGELATGP